MKRDWDVIRSVLLRVEESNSEKEVSSDDFKPIDEGLVAYNMWLLIDAEMAEGGGRRPGMVNAPPYAFINHLTWQGHELLDEIRGDTVWNRVKAIAKEKGVDLTIDSIKALAKIALQRALGG